MIQNKVPGIHLDLQDGHHVELAFMPGMLAPFRLLLVHRKAHGMLMQAHLPIQATGMSC